MSDDEARALIDNAGGIKRLGICHPACITFELVDGQHLTLWEGSNEHDREWDLER